MNKIKKVSIPIWSDFKQALKTVILDFNNKSLFQYGLISNTNKVAEGFKSIVESLYSNMVWFQTCEPDEKINNEFIVSIPIWSDFKLYVILRCIVMLYMSLFQYGLISNIFSPSRCRHFILVSIPIWSDFKLNIGINYPVAYLVSIPIWSDFKQKQRTFSKNTINGSLFQYGLISNIDKKAIMGNMYSLSLFQYGLISN